MATIYQKVAADRTNILAPRECYFRPFNFDNWTEMRMGVLFGGVTSGGDNTQAVSESIVQSTVADLIAFGIKDSATSFLPGQSGSLFLGAISYDSTADCDGSSFFSNSGGNGLAAAGYNGTSLIGGTGTQIINLMSFPANITVTSSYDGFFALKFVINNRGLSSQSVTISSTFTQTVSGSDYSAGALRTLINNATYGMARTITWNDGVSALTIPDAVWIRLPFYSNRIRLSQPSPMLVRYAP